MSWFALLFDSERQKWLTTISFFYSCRRSHGRLGFLREFRRVEKRVESLQVVLTCPFLPPSFVQVGVGQLFFSPVKGAINTATALPKGVYNILDSVHEGLSNLPSMYGSDVRDPGKITGIGTGLKEAAKGYAYGSEYIAFESLSSIKRC